MSVTEVTDELLARADAALDSGARFLLAMRSGYHADMLAIGLAGYISGEIAGLYRKRLAALVAERGSEAVDASLPHLRRVADGEGHATVEIVEAAFQLGPLVTMLQTATRVFVGTAESVTEIQERAHAEALGCILGEWIVESGDIAGLADGRFATEINARARTADRCAAATYRLVLDWIEPAAHEAVARAALERFDLLDLERLLGLRPLEPADHARLLGDRTAQERLDVPPIFTDGLAAIPTNQAGWALLTAIHDAVGGRNWTDAGGRRVPTHRTPAGRGRGAVEVSLRDRDGAPEAEPDRLAGLWEKVHALDDLTSDALLVCLAAWTSAGGRPDTPVWVTADAILDARGIQRIQRRGEPREWQHGHRREDRLAAGRALAQLDHLWLEVVGVEVIPGGRHRTPARISVESRAMTILDRVTERDAFGEATFLAARVMPGDWARAWWDLGLRQVGLLAGAALAYDPYRELPEKRLAKYLAFSFRWNARQRGEPLLRRVETLLTNAGLDSDPSRPQRARDRLERALARLADDGVIASWRYTTDPADLPARHWLPRWREMTIEIASPEELVRGNAKLRRGGVIGPGSE